MTTKPKAADLRLERTARLRWVPLNKMETPAISQRDFRPTWAEHIAANIDLEMLGNPVVSERDGVFYIIDGQHRIAAYKIWLGDGWETQQVQCWTYTGLSEAEESETFLKLNDRLAVGAMDRYHVGISAGRAVECDVDRIVRSHGLTVGVHDGQIHAVGTLMKIYKRYGPKDLSRTIRIVNESYGDSGFEAVVIDGVGQLCGRYGGALDVEFAIKQLSNAAGGVNAVLGKAEQIRARSRQPKGYCVAAAAVEVINRGAPKTQRLSNWWANDEGDEE